MNKGQLVEKIAEDSEISKKDAQKALESFVEVITNELSEGGTVTLIGFGTFKVTNRAARTGRNPQTGESLQIPASKVPSWKASKNLIS